MTLAEKLVQFERLLKIMDELREQCPWDREQTWESIRHLTLEESAELNDALLEGNVDEVKKELGDILLHIIFYSKIADEQSHFDIGHVIDGLCNKLIRRHPHIYGDVVADDPDTVKQNWEKIKMEEKGGNQPRSVLDGVPKSMSALVKAYRMQEKVAQVGFDWKEAQDVLNKVHEELEELRSAENKEEETAEFGDLLFALVNYARFRNINPDDALEKTNRKFLQRFRHIEKRAAEEGKILGKMALEEMDVYWNEAKALGY